MRIAIVDDIASERTLLHARLQQQLVKRGVHADLAEFENGEFFLESRKRTVFCSLVSGYLHGRGKRCRDCQRTSEI